MNAAGEIEGRRGSVEKIAPVVVSLEELIGSSAGVAPNGNRLYLTAAADWTLVDVGGNGSCVDLRRRARFVPVPVDGAGSRRIRPGGRAGRGLEAVRSLVHQREPGIGPHAHARIRVSIGTIEKPFSLVQSSVVQVAQSGGGVVQATVLEGDGAPAELTAVAHHTQVVGLAVDLVVTPVVQPEVVAELMHECAGLLVRGSTVVRDSWGDGPRRDRRRGEGPHRDRRIVSRHLRAARAFRAGWLGTGQVVAEEHVAEGQALRVQGFGPAGALGGGPEVRLLDGVEVRRVAEALDVLGGGAVRVDGDGRRGAGREHQLGDVSRRRVCEGGERNLLVDLDMELDAGNTVRINDRRRPESLPDALDAGHG